MRNEDAIAIIDELVLGLQGAIRELAWVAHTAKHDSARVGAIRARVDAMEKLAGLLQSVGVLPMNLGKLRVELDVRFLADTILEVLTEEAVPEHIIDRLMQALDRAPANQAGAPPSLAQASLN
jgi:hypothetical protein